MSDIATDLTILRVGSGWNLISDGRTLGRFAYRVDAEEAGLRLIEKGRQAHQVVRLQIQDERGRLRPFAS